MKKLLVVLALVSLAAQAKKQSPADISKCAERIQEQCSISNNDEKRIKSNATVCKQVQSFGEKMEAVVLDSGDVTVVQVTNNCRITKYDLGPSTQIEDLKVIGGRAYMATGRGAVFYFRANNNGSPIFWEIMSASGRSYSVVDDVKGTNGGQSVQFLDKNGSPLQIVNGQTDVDQAEITMLTEKGRLRQVPFYHAPADRSLFRN